MDLFGPAGRSGDEGGAASRRSSSFDVDASAPLAARMRPRTLDEFVGQEQLLGEGKALRGLIEQDEVGSLIFWGPPGTGKTTLARIIAERTEAHFEPFSAVMEGVPRVREIIKQARERRRAGLGHTILFCDEIHRFNKAQQDAFLPHVEAGTVSLIGATTENPSFEVIGALLSRSRVFVLEPLGPDQISSIVDRALADEDRGLGGLRITLDAEARNALTREVDGDARRALNALETAATLAGAGASIGVDHIREALQRRFAHYDKGGEEHYNLISALHKAVRGSDPHAALYWLARMLDGGEDPLYVARRLVRMAIEDIGLADPEALRICVAARDAYHFLGSPEGDLALAQAALYLATAPKSNRVYRAYGQAMGDARETPAAPVPLHIRNAPTRLMKELGYGKDYRYAFDSEDHYIPQEYLPDELRGHAYYEPSGFGFEKRIAERMKWWDERRRSAPDGTSEGGAEYKETRGDEPGPDDDTGDTDEEGR